MIEAEKKRKDDQIAYEQQQTEQWKNRPKAPQGLRNDKQLHVAFIQMGQGDCTIISTPNGKTILIDCGTTATEIDNKDEFHRSVSDIIYGPAFLSNYNKIDILILTHPDFDHINRLQQVLADNVQIGVCYHSYPFNSYGKGGLSEEKENVSTWIWNQMSETATFAIKQVTASQDGRKVQMVDETTYDLSGQHGLNEKIDDRGAIRIVEETIDPTTTTITTTTTLTTATTPSISSTAIPQTTAATTTATGSSTPPSGAPQAIVPATSVPATCNISILASNVTKECKKGPNYRDGTPDNRSSIVVLIEAFGKKIMICGDATGGTEEFIYQTYPGVNNLDVLQVPHHGTKTTSSTLQFVQRMQPLNCIISAPLEGTKYGHPSYEVIQSYIQTGRLLHNVPPHTIRSYEETKKQSIVEGGKDETEKDQREDTTTAAIYITGSYGTCVLTVSENQFSIGTP